MTSSSIADQQERILDTDLEDALGKPFPVSWFS